MSIIEAESELVITCAPIDRLKWTIEQEKTALLDLHVTSIRRIDRGYLFDVFNLIEKAFAIFVLKGGGHVDMS